jgi:hypothetical protein
MAMFVWSGWLAGGLCSLPTLNTLQIDRIELKRMPSNKSQFGLAVPVPFITG